MAAKVFDSDLNLKATELRLALPGTDDVTTTTTTKKRSAHEITDDQNQCAAKTQIVGWPPVRSNRISTLNRVNGSGLYVKVNMDGAPFLRKVDLKALNGYGDLLKALEGMFKVTIGGYSEEGYGGSDYTPSYEDKDGDWMLVGDVPWEMFVSSCKRLRIIKSL